MSMPLFLPALQQNRVFFGGKTSVKTTVKPEDMPLKDATFVVMDTETMGTVKGKPESALSAKTSTLLEVTAIKYRGGKIVGKFSTLVNPGQHIPKAASKLTHITDEMVKDKPEAKEVLKQLAAFVGPNPNFVCHYANYDIPQIQERLKEAGLTQYLDRFDLAKTFCTKTLIQRLFPRLERMHPRRRGLSQSAGIFMLVNNQPHRAESDVETTGNLFHAIMNVLRMQGKRFGSVQKFLTYQGPAITKHNGTPGKRG